MTAKQALAQRRRMRVRRKVVGTSERPRLCASRSLRHMRAQIIDDYSGRTLVSASTQEREVAEGLKGTGNIEAAKRVGLVLGQRAVAAGIKQVVFDRAGRPYHGRVQAVAEGAREAGLAL